jgi:hypothetical protein
VAAYKRLGRGHVILMTDDLIATNAGIAKDDNAVFLVNVAAAGSNRARSLVAFDEYHHGVGFETNRSGDFGVLLQRMPGPLKASLIALMSFAIIVVLEGNIRTIPVSRVQTVAVRPAGQYVRSMARLYRRVGARNLAIQTMYVQLLRDLERELRLTGDALPSDIISNASIQLNVDSGTLTSIVNRCERCIAGSKLTEREMIELAQAIERFRRESGIVRNR